MRKSQSSTGSRLLRAGIATAATAALVVGASATPAYATDVAFATSPSTGALGASTTVTATGTGVLTSITTPGARVVASGATCSTTFGTTSPTLIAVTVSKTNDGVASITAPATLAPGAYRFCLYAGTTGTSAIAGHATTDFTIGTATPTLAPAVGPAASGGTITATGANPYLSSTTTIGATLSIAACPATYTNSGANIVSTVVKTGNSVATVTTPAGLTAPNLYNVCIYNGTAGASALLGSASYTALPALTLSQSSGPTGGTNTVTATSPTKILLGITTPGVTMSRAVCPNTYTTTGNEVPTPITRISDNKLAFPIPSTVALATNQQGALTELSAAYNVCVYTGTSGTDTLIAAPPTYTINPVLGLATSNTVNPPGGPSQGGSFVTITGSGFPYPATVDTVVSASLGGSPIDQLRVTSATTMTGYTTAHAAGPVTLSVTTASGTKTKASAFTYSYGIQIAPTTAAGGSSPASLTLDILGAGFSGLTFNAVGNTSDAHVFLVNDTYDNTADSSVTTSWATPPVTECTGVIPIGDQEILCTLNLAKRLSAAGALTTSTVPDGTYTVIVVSSGAVGATLNQPDKSIISSGSTFTVAPY